MARPHNYCERRKAELSEITVEQLLSLLGQPDVTFEDWVRYLDIAQERLKSGRETGSHVERFIGEVELLLVAWPPTPDYNQQLRTRSVGVPVDRSMLADEAEQAFRRDLPTLLADAIGQWVAYHGSRRVGIARTDLELYRKCRELGLPNNECVVRPVEADLMDVILLQDYPVA